MCRFTIRDVLWLTVLVVAALLAPPASTQDKGDPAEALYGEWEIVEMIRGGKVQDFRGKSGGWFEFEPRGFIVSFNAEQRDEATQNKILRKQVTYPCTIRPHEIDIVIKQPNGNGELVKARYDLTDGKLRIIWNREYGERPTDFDDAIKDPRLTLFVLKKAK